MKIKSMRVENFLSFGEAEFDFDEAGLVLVEGENLDDKSAQSNGSGKSAMIDALVWCLFGTTLRGYENDEVINRKVGENCSVMVVLQPDHGGDEYGIYRSRKHERTKNQLILSTQGADASGANNTETQEEIEKLLGCSKRTFLSSVVFGQDRAYRFSSLTDKDQKEILDEVLGVGRFASACLIARGEMNDLVLSVDRGHAGLERAEEIIAEVERELKDLRKKNDSFEEDHEKRLEEEREKLKKANKWIKENAKVGTEVLRAAVEVAQKNLTACEKEMTSAGKATTKVKVEHATWKTKLDSAKAAVKKHEQLEGECPTCGQVIDKKKHARALAESKKVLSAAEDELETLDGAIELAEKVEAKAERKLREARDNVLAAQKALNEGVGAEANVVAWKRRAADHTARIKELDDEKNPYTPLIERVETRLEKHLKEKKLIKTQLDAEEKKLKLSDFWVKAFGAKGLRSLLIDSSLPLLNEEAARISRAVTGGAISIEFSAVSELKSGKSVDRFEVKVDNKHGAGSYQGNSAGERAKVDLCVGLALQKLVASRSKSTFNVAFYDEIFDHLDSAAHERVVEVLSEIDKDSVFVVSHNDDLKAWFPATLTITKKDGFSSVE